MGGNASFGPSRQGLARLELRLEAGQNPWPAGTDLSQHLGAGGQRLVSDAQAHHVFDGFELEGDATMLAAVRRIGRFRPGQHQPVWRIALDDFTDQIQRVAIIDATMFPARSGLPVGNVFVRPILPREASIEQSMPDLLGRCPNVDYVDETCVTHLASFRYAV